MSTKQKPSVNRAVHFWYSAHEGPIAAIITAVNHDGTCELTVFSAEPTHSPVLRKSSVPFAKEPTPLHWNWPPRV